MNENNNTNNLIYFTLVFFTFSIFGLRDNYFISDGLNYIEHAKINFDLSNSATYHYIIYWALIGLLSTWFEPDLIPGILSLITSGLIILSSLRLKSSDRWIFLFFCIFSSVIFNITQVALRNGIALGLILLAIAYGRTIFLVLTPMIHPGTFPIILILFLLKYANGHRKAIGAATALGFVIFLLAPYFETSLESRGYTAEGRSRLADATTYISVIFLACVYYLSFKKNPYRFFMPLMVAIWIFVSFKYEFGGRLFLQSFLISLFLLLKFSENKKFRRLYLFCFFIFSFYGSILWHPLLEFYDGWIGYWSSLI